MQQDAKLLDAADKGSLHDVRSALDSGANIEAMDNNDCTSLVNASYHGHTDVVRELLARGANVNAEDDLGQTSLMEATVADSLEIVRELLARGANVMAKNRRGKTARMIADEHNDIDIADLLRKKEQVIARRGVAEMNVKTQNLPIDVSKKIVGYLGGRKSRTKRKLTRRKKQQKGTRRR